MNLFTVHDIFRGLEGLHEPSAIIVRFLFTCYIRRLEVCFEPTAHSFLCAPFSWTVEGARKSRCLYRCALLVTYLKVIYTHVQAPWHVTVCGPLALQAPQEAITRRPATTINISKVPSGTKTRGAPRDVHMVCAAAAAAAATFAAPLCGQARASYVRVYCWALPRMRPPLSPLYSLHAVARWTASPLTPSPPSLPAVPPSLPRTTPTLAAPYRNPLSFARVRTLGFGPDTSSFIAGKDCSGQEFQSTHRTRVR